MTDLENAEAVRYLQDRMDRAGVEPWTVSFKGALQTLNNLMPLLDTSLSTDAWCEAVLAAVDVTGRGRVVRPFVAAVREATRAAAGPGSAGSARNRAVRYARIRSCRRNRPPPRGTTRFAIASGVTPDRGLARRVAVQADQRRELLGQSTDDRNGQQRQGEEQRGQPARPVGPRPVHPATEHIPVARSNGITHTVALPAGGGDGGFPGQGSLVSLDGWTVEEMDVVPGAVMVMSWPSIRTRVGGFFGGGGRERSYDEAREEYERAVAELEQWLDAARSYRRSVEGGATIPRDLRLEALAKVTSGEMPVLAQVDAERDIRNVVEFAEAQGLRLILGGASEGYRVADLLASKGIPVILGPTQSMPRGDDRGFDEPYANPGMLHAAGVTIAFATFGSSDSRTLPYEAAMAIPFGLPREAALRAITLAPAEILGVADRLGTIQEGKIANLIVTDGDPLEITTQVRHLVIEGVEVPLMNRHQQLYERYRSRPVGGR